MTKAITADHRAWDVWFPVGSNLGQVGVGVTSGIEDRLSMT